MVQVTACRLFLLSIEPPEKNISEIRIELNKNAVLKDANKQIVVQLVYLKEMLKRNIFDTDAT